MANPAHGGNSYWYITRKSYVVYRIISTHLFSNYADITLIVFLSRCSLWCSNFLDATFLQPFSGVGIVSLNDVQMFHLHGKKRIHEWSMRRLFILHLFTVVKYVYIYLHTERLSKKAYLRDLIAASGGVILIKLDLNRRFFGPCDL